MKLSTHLVAVLMSLAALQQFAVADDTPLVLIVGKWQDSAEPDDAVIEFIEDGTGKITETTSEKTAEVNTLWKVTETYGNACIVVVEYDVPEPKPKAAKPFTWLIAFDGKDKFVTQPIANKIVFMVRQK